MYLSVHHSEIEVVACAEIGGGHYEIVPFFPNNYPHDSVAGFKNVFFNAFFFDCFPSLCEPLTERVGEPFLVSFFDFFGLCYFAADLVKCFEFRRF